MDIIIRGLLDQVASVPDYLGVEFSDINDTNAFGDSALHCVCAWGDLEAVKLLVENGINIHQKGEGGFTPLKMAHDFEYHEIVEYLIFKGADPKAIDAKFIFFPDANEKHMNNIKDGISELEKEISTQCGKNA